MTLVIATKTELPPWIAGFFFLAAAVAMAAQMFHTYRAGFMYCGRSFQNGAFLEAHKKENPLKYQIFLGVHILIVVTLLAFSVLGFWRAVQNEKKMREPNQQPQQQRP